jgi:hypothetical protein
MRICGLALAVGILCLPVSALATGGVGCTVQDDNMDFSFEALFGRGVVTPLFQVKASLGVKNRKVHGKAKTIEMDDSHLKQQWFHGSDLKLLFYVEATDKDAPFSAATLTVEAAQPPGGDIAYNGRYVLELEGAAADGGNGEPVKFEGRIDCSAG